MKTFFSFPFLLIYVLLLLGLLWHWQYKRLAQMVLLSLIIGIYLLSTPLMTRLLFELIGGQAQALSPQQVSQTKAQMIVVLGGGFYRGVEFNHQSHAAFRSLSRVHYAAYLAKKTQLPILLSGYEAPAMANTLHSFGLQAQLIEAQSLDTDQNAQFSAKLLLALEIKNVVLVTDAWHISRAQLAFEHYGLNIVPAPTDLPDGFFEQSPPWWSARAFLFQYNLQGIAEVLGHVKYRLAYF